MNSVETLVGEVFERSDGNVKNYFLVTSLGEEFLLRKRGSNPLKDRSVQQYVNTTVEVQGTKNGKTFIFDEIEECG